MLTKKLIHGDGLDVLRTIPDKSVQLVCVDPPYYKVIQNEWDNQWKSVEEYIEWCRLWTNECKRILKKDGSFYVFQGWENVAEYVVMAKTVFPYMINWIAWERIKGRSSNINWKSTKEELLFFSNSSNPKFIPQPKIRPVIAPYKDKDGKPKGWYVDEEGNRVRWTGTGNVWHYTPPVWSSKEEPPTHPTQKPLMMLERIIRSSTYPGDTVVDCFAGSGTTLVAAKKLYRSYIGVEKDKEYYKLCSDRLESTQ